jgi:hypothetical protein
VQLAGPGAGPQPVEPVGAVVLSAEDDRTAACAERS